MCQRCGCQQFINGGQETIRKRVVDIIEELRLNTTNLDDYENTEVISSLIAPFSNTEDEIYATASWVSALHEGVRQSNRDERYQTHARAFQDIFSRLPVQGDPKHIATTYHQLEQLARDLDETTLTSLDLDTQETIQAVNHVHEDTTRQTRLKERYGL